MVILAEPRADARRGRAGSPSRASARDRHLCLADFFRRRESPGRSTSSAFTVVTMGQRIADYANELFAANAYRDYLEVHGLSVQLTEALAEFWHQRIRSELVFADGSDRGRDDDPDDSRRSSTWPTAAPGTRSAIPACPDLADQTKVMELLRPGADRRELSEEFQLHPEQSTSALVVHHPEAKYFAAR